jgi:hypothetical protein
MLFTTWLHSTRRLSAAAVSMDLASFRSLHVDHSFPDLHKDTLRLHRVLRGIKHSLVPCRSSRLQVTQPILLAIQSALSPAVYDHCMFAAPVPSLLFGFLGVSEFSCLVCLTPMSIYQCQHVF